MKQENIAQPIFVIGLELRTNNDTAFQDIPPFWGRFYQENIAGKVPNKVSDEVYGIYTHFENEGVNNKGTYSLILGCPVSNLKEVPEGMISCTIPPSNFIVFPVESGKPEKVGEKWMEIWKRGENDKEFDQKRTYLCDFERYNSTGEINIFIGTK